MFSIDSTYKHENNFLLLDEGPAMILMIVLVKQKKIQY